MRSKKYLQRLDGELRSNDQPLTLPYLKDRLKKVIANTNTLHKLQYRRDTLTEFGYQMRYDDYNMEKGNDSKMRLSNVFGVEPEFHLDQFVPTIFSLFNQIRSKVDSSIRFKLDDDAENLHKLLVNNRVEQRDLMDLNDICIEMLYLSNFLHGNVLEHRKAAGTDESKFTIAGMDLNMDIKKLSTFEREVFLGVTETNEASYYGNRSSVDMGWHFIKDKQQSNTQVKMPTTE